MAAIGKSNNKGSGSSSGSGSNSSTSNSERLKTSDKPTPLLPLIMDAKRWQKITHYKYIQTCAWRLVCECACCAHALSLTVKQFKFLFCDDATSSSNNNNNNNNNKQQEQQQQLLASHVKLCVWCHLAGALLQFK